MNFVTFRGKKFTVRFLATVTIAAMILSVFPAAFFVAQAASTGISLNKAEATTLINVQVNFVVSATNDGESTSGTYIKLDDNGGGGEFYNGTVEGACNAVTPDTDDYFAIANNKGVCYSNDTEGEYTITVQLLTGIGGDPIGVSVNIKIKVEDNAEHKVDICHWNGEVFNLLNVAKSSIGNAHGSQGVNDGDIIPAFDDYEGYNLDEDYNGDTGAQVLENDCEVPPPPIYGCMEEDADNYNPDATEQGEVVCEYEPKRCENLLENGSFEIDEVDTEAFPELWQKFASVTGWIVQKVSDDSATTLELHRDWMSNEAAEGEQYTELDGDQPVRISQPVATIPGAIYELSWTFAPRQDTAEVENELGVEVDGVQVAVTGPSVGIGELDVEDWTLDSYEFEALKETTEISFFDLGPESIESGPDVGTFLDDAQLCLVREPEAEMCELTIVSSPASVVVENNAFAVATYDEHLSWTTLIPGATWIWESFFVADPVGETTRTFEETFIVTDVETASLTVAADNSYKISVNDVEVGGDPSEYNFFAGDEDVYTQDDLNFIDGENTLRIEVKNWQQGGGTAESNPAGALYKLVIAAEDDCEVTTDIDDVIPPDETFKIEGYKYEVVGGDSSPVPVEDWEIFAYNSDDDTSLSTTTDANGYYWFEVEEGTWEVSEEMPEGWEQNDVEQDGYSVEPFGESSELYCVFELYEEEWNEEYKPLAFVYSQDEDPDSNCDFYNSRLPIDDEEEEVDESQEDNNRSGGGSGTRVKKPTPKVAGASASFCPLINDYMQIGIENDPVEVMKLQMFLNIFVASTSVTGIFDETTDAHVKLFQEMHRDEILEPWFKLGIVPHNHATGFVYKLTRWKINDIVCPGSEPYPSFDGENLTNNVDLD